MAQPTPRRTLDFFAAQAAAKRHTGLLVLLFALAWLGTIVLVDVGLAVALGGDPATLLLPVAAGVTLVVLLGSGFHAVRLAAGGGDAVARMLGGRAVDRQTSDPAERRLVNVVEEMAIASGLPVPRLYVLDGDAGINAFAAGFTPERSVVAVTRGALEQLDRDELQGVMAHELSHVLNSDTRLSTRLMAMVGGLTVLALLGRILLRADVRDREGRSTAAVGVGLCLLVAGSVGAFFGRLIRLAVSRQREFLADAASAQFTRNPEGLARALAKIEQQGSRISSPGALEASHLFFAEGVGGFLSGLLATHPPVEERIRRLLPQGLVAGARPAAATAVTVLPATAAAVLPSSAEPILPTTAVPAVAAAAEAFSRTVGRPGPENAARAGLLLAALPPALLAAAREPSGARALACALLLSDGADREAGLGALSPEAGLRDEVRGLASALDGVPRQERLAVLDLALPALDHLSGSQASSLQGDLAAVARADGRTTAFEWAVERIVGRRLAPLLGGSRTTPVRVRDVGEVQVECLELLSALAWAGERDAVPAQRALDAALRVLGVPARWSILPDGRVDGARLDAALARLDEAAPELKRRILSACAACVLADARIVPSEMEVVRAIAASLGCPVPLLRVESRTGDPAGSPAPADQGR
jgi:Zn-dependent protease with chaperone function